MDPITYSAQAIRTEKAEELAPQIIRALACNTLDGADAEKNRPSKTPDGPKLYPIIRLLHGILGIVGEVGELTDALKRYLVYNQPLDRTNVLEEAGDILWYLNLCLLSVGATFEEAMEANIAKLTVRFPDKFTDALAAHRDLAAERRALERNPLPKMPTLPPRDGVNDVALGGWSAEGAIHEAEMEDTQGRAVRIGMEFRPVAGLDPIDTFNSYQEWVDAQIAKLQKQMPLGWEVTYHGYSGKFLAAFNGSTK